MASGKAHTDTKRVIGMVSCHRV